MAGEVPPLALVIIVRPDGSCETVRIVGDDPPTLEVIDRLARLQLMTRRQGGRIRLEALSAALGQLLELTGLGRELGGETEGGEEPVGLEEGMDP
jgi:hypothetical protein